MNSGIFLRGRLDDPNQPEIVQQIAVYTQRDWGPFEGSERSARAAGVEARRAG
jgi:hypothetical protein